MKLIIFIALLMGGFILVEDGYAQEIMREGGLKATGSGGVNLLSANHWSTMNNPAALPMSGDFSAGLHLRNRYQVEGLYEGALAVGYAMGKEDGFGGSVSYFSHESHHIEQNWRFAYGRKLTENFFGGIHLDLFYRSLSLGDSDFMPTGGFGAYYREESWTLSASVFNPFGQVYRERKDLPPLNMVSAGAQYEFSEILAMFTHFQYSSSISNNLSGGVQYQPIDDLTLRKAVGFIPLSQYLSIEFAFMNLSAGMAFKWHPTLGFDSHAGMDYFYEEH